MQRQGQAGIPQRLVLGSDTASVNADTFTLAALAARIPIDVTTTAYVSEDGLRQLLGSASYFGYVKNAADSPFNSLGPAVIALVGTDPRFHQFISATLPDGSQLHILAAREPPSPRQLTQTGELLQKSGGPRECSIRFGEGIELTGVSLERVPNGIQARYRWHSWRRIPRNYWSFGHIMDAQGKVLGFLDHAILPQTPTSQWEVGDSALEKVFVPISAGSGSPARTVRLGVFDRHSGDRLPVMSSTFPLADDGTSTVVPIN
jgi:hypothetical protein